MATNTTVNGKKYFKITRTIGHEYVDGVKKPIKKQFYGSSERDAKRKYDLWKESHKNVELLDTVKTFGELAEHYYENILLIDDSYSYGTRNLYGGAYKKYVRQCSLSSIPIASLTQQDIQKYYNNIDVSKASMATVHKFMRAFIKWGYHNNYCKNIIDGVIVPSKHVNRRQEDIITWSDDEINIIFTAEPDYYLLPLITFALYSGLRISELLGLKWSDIDDKKIRVRRQFYRGEWCPPKGNKERDVPIHDRIRNIVEQSDKTNDLVFCTTSGRPLDYNNVTTSLDRFYNRINIEHKKFHAYRATFVTNLCRNGVPIQIASRIAGHANINVTSKYYTSVQYDEMNEAIKKLK